MPLHSLTRTITMATNLMCACRLTFGLDKMVLVRLLYGAVALRGIKGKGLQVETSSLITKAT